MEHEFHSDFLFCFIVQNTVWWGQVCVERVFAVVFFCLSICNNNHNLKIKFVRRRAKLVADKHGLTVFGRF